MLYGWKENSMLTNCLAECAHLTITVSEIERDIYEKIVILSYPLHSTPPLGGGFPWEYCHPVWCGKTRMATVKNFEDMCYLPFRHNTGVWQTDGQTDILPQHSPRYAYASRGKNLKKNWWMYVKPIASQTSGHFFRHIDDNLPLIHINLFQFTNTTKQQFIERNKWR